MHGASWHHQINHSNLIPLVSLCVKIKREIIYAMTELEGKSKKKKKGEKAPTMGPNTTDQDPPITLLLNGKQIYSLSIFTHSDDL